MIKRCFEICTGVSNACIVWTKSHCLKMITTKSVIFRTTHVGHSFEMSLVWDGLGNKSRSQSFCLDDQTAALRAHHFHNE